MGKDNNMVYAYLVKHNGVYYKPGENVPDDKPIVAEEKAVEEPKEEKVTEKKYSRSEIQLMKVDDLKSLAKEKGIDGYEEKSGNALKKELISLLGL